MKTLKISVFVIFALWGLVRYLNATYPWGGPRPTAVEKAAMMPYTDQDRARDAARAEYLQRQIDRDPVLQRALEISKSQ